MEFAQKFRRTVFFFFENGNFEKIEKQNDERPFEKINRNSGNKFLEVLNKWFFCQEKKSIYLVRKNTIEKQKQTGKGAKQQRRWNKNSFTERDEQMKKEVFFLKKKKNKGEFSKKGINRGSTRERESK